MINELLKIYPNSLLNPTKARIKEMNDYYHIQGNSDHLYISLEHLNEEEIQLLKLLVQDKEVKPSPLNPLEKILLEGRINDTFNLDTVQLIYLKIDHLDEKNYKLWKDTLQNSIEKIVDLTMIGENLIVLLMDMEEVENQSLEKLKEVIISLDQDFNLLSQGMIGQVTSFNQQIKDVFSYESKIFENFIQNRRINGIVSLSTLLINQMAFLFKQEEPKLVKLFTVLANKPDLTELIDSLFKNQGNLSQTANDLFIHRNTLSYQINKFYDKTGFNLNDFPDLIVCYLLTN